MSQKPESLEALERELASLRPAPPSNACEAKLEVRLRSVRPSLLSRPSLAEWRPLAGVATLVFCLGGLAAWLERGAAPEPAPAAAVAELPPGLRVVTPPRESPALRILRPIDATQVLLSATPEGVVRLEDGSYAHRIRTRSVQRLGFAEQSGSTQLTYSVPREDIVLVPVNAF